MNELVTIKGNNVFTDTLIIADGINRKHDSVTKLIKRYRDDFEELGKVGLTVRASASGQKQNVYTLNETQAVFLLTLMDNSILVIKFKKELSKQFVAMRNILMQRSSSEWLQTRKQGKLTRRQEVDVLALLVDYAKNQGSKNADKMYLTYTKLVNGAVGLQGGQREYATEKVLSIIALFEDMILHTVQEDMSNGVFYKDIYQNCKRKINEMMKYVYLPNEKLLIA